MLSKSIRNSNNVLELNMRQDIFPLAFVSSAIRSVDTERDYIEQNSVKLSPRVNNLFIFIINFSEFLDSMSLLRIENDLW